MADLIIKMPETGKSQAYWKLENLNYYFVDDFSTTYKISHASRNHT